MSIIPIRYQDMWTVVAGFYTIDPIVADGGEVVIYGSRITDVSVMYPHIVEIGYHFWDYFMN